MSLMPSPRSVALSRSRVMTDRPCTVDDMAFRAVGRPCRRSSIFAMDSSVCFAENPSVCMTRG